MSAGAAASVTPSRSSGDAAAAGVAPEHGPAVGWESRLVACGAFALIAAAAGSHGGYAPPAWGWFTLLLGWLAALALLLRHRVRLGALGLATLGALLLLVAWTGLSITWSDDSPQSVLELQRALLYLTAALAGLVAVRGRSVPHLLGGALAAITAVSVYGLGTRLFPSGGGRLDTIILNRLADPIGYWNALGIFAAMGALLALGFAAHARRPAARAAAAAAFPVLLTTLYFTYSRGGWLAAIGGLIAAVAIDPRRLKLVTAGMLLAGPAAAAVLVSSGSGGLTRLRAPQDVITREGRSLALALAVLAAAAALLTLLAGWGESRVRIGAGARRAYGGALALALVVALAVVFGHFGGPTTLAGDALRSFKEEQPARAPAPRDAGDLNSRLFTLRSNGRIDYWRAARDQHRAHPVRGAGAGSFEQYWLRERPYASQVRDAHGLYAEVLGDLGWVGLGLLLAALLVPLVAGTRVRRHPLVPGALGAYVAFLLHAGADWDWEMPAVVLVALACAIGFLLLDRRRGGRSWAPSFAVRAAMVGAVAVVAAFSVVGIVGNRAVVAATAAADDGRYSQVAGPARTAKRWAPWSAGGRHALGRAQAALGRRRQARSSLLVAARKDPSDWRIWYDLGASSAGPQRRRAYRRAARLNPLAQDVAALREQRRLPRLKGDAR